MTDIPFSRRWKLWLIAWGVGLVAAGFPNPALIFYVWFFPSGLAKAFDRPFPAYDIAIGWLIYLLLTAFAFLSRPRVLYFTFFGIFCILLLLNAVGCQRMLGQMFEKTH